MGREAEKEVADGATNADTTRLQAIRENLDQASRIIRQGQREIEQVASKS